MNMNNDFIDEFGREMFEEVFSVIYGDMKSERVVIKSKRYSNSTNCYGDGTLTLNGKTVEFRFVDGNNNGSEIVEYGDKLEAVPHYATVHIFKLDEERLIAEGNEDSIPLMRKKFDSLKDEIAEKQRAYNYDIRVEPSNAIQNHYSEWCNQKYLKIVSTQVETDY